MLNEKSMMSMSVPIAPASESEASDEEARKLAEDIEILEKRKGRLREKMDRIKK